MERPAPATLSDPSGLEPCSDATSACDPANVGHAPGGNGAPMGEHSGGGDNRATLDQSNMLQYANPSAYATAVLNQAHLVAVGPMGGTVPSAGAGTVKYPQAYADYCSVLGSSCLAYEASVTTRMESDAVKSDGAREANRERTNIPATWLDFAFPRRPDLTADHRGRRFISRVYSGAPATHR